MKFVEGLERRVLLSAWFVAPTGSDANAGTLRKPFQTIQHAADVAQPGDTVYLRKGAYRETVVPAQSGTATAPITFERYHHEAVTIDGADPIAGFTAGANGSWTASMPWDMADGKNQVFLNGAPLTEARWPNNASATADPWHQSYAQVGAITDQGTQDGLATVTISVPALTDPAGTWVGATIHIAPGQEWVFQTGTVIASAPGSLTYSYTQLDPSQYQMPQAGNRFYLTGLPAALDAAGEWYFNSSAQTLSMIPLTGGAPTGIEAKQRLYAFDLSGRSYINIVGVKLFSCTLNTDAGSIHDTIDSISASYVSQESIKADPWADKLAPHTTGIILNGSDDVIQNSIIAGSSGDGIFLGGSNNIARNCIIHDVDTIGADEAGVTIMGSNDQVISNTIYNAGRSGIVMRFSPAASVLHNRISNGGLLTTDLGGIYTWGTDGQNSVIAYNLINGFHSGGFGSSGIYLDNSSTDYLVHHNVVWDTDNALKMNEPSDNNQIDNNTLAGTQLSVASDDASNMAGSILMNNLFTAPTQIDPSAQQTDNLALPGAQFTNVGRCDLRLRGKSPAINAGTVVPGITDGYAGSAPDIGAYEFGRKPFVAGANPRIARNK
ncbi:MAG TPA: right-handed parallel beta-helix repeat-containing protein [Tepidisphaeraceae bacterium]|nr:right-handed parallel beta-helix repeat-containing protein [Tepidisphaeraceae bacterium]